MKLTGTKLLRVRGRQLAERMRIVRERPHYVASEGVEECPRCAWLNRIQGWGQDSPVLCGLFLTPPFYEVEGGDTESE